MSYQLHAVHFRDGRAVVAWEFRESLPPSLAGGSRVVSSVSIISLKLLFATSAFRLLPGSGIISTGAGACAPSPKFRESLPSPEPAAQRRPPFLPTAGKSENPSPHPALCPPAVELRASSGGAGPLENATRIPTSNSSWALPNEDWWGVYPGIATRCVRLVQQWRIRGLWFTRGVPGAEIPRIVAPPLQQEWPPPPAPPPGVPRMFALPAAGECSCHPSAVPPHIRLRGRYRESLPLELFHESPSCSVSGWGGLKWAGIQRTLAFLPGI